MGSLSLTTSLVNIVQRPCESIPPERLLHTFATKIRIASQDKNLLAVEASLLTEVTGSLLVLRASKTGRSGLINIAALSANPT